MTTAPSDDDEGLGRLLSASFDGDLEAEQAVELARLINVAAPQTWAPLLDLELTLRSLPPAPSVADEVLRVLQTRAPAAHPRATTTTTPVRLAPRRRRARWLAGLLLGASAFAVAAPVAWRRLHRIAQPDPARRGAGEAAPEFPVANHAPIFVPPLAPADPPPEPRQGPAAVAQDPAAASDRPSGGPGSIVRRFDFEDGQLPAGFSSGEVVEPETPREGSRYAILGNLGRHAPTMRSIVYQPAEWLVAYDDDLLLRFQYFLGPGGHQVRLQIYNRDQRQNYQFAVPAPVVNQWTRVEVPLRAFYPVRDRSKRFEPGGQLTILYFMGGILSGITFLVDDIELVRASPAP